MARIVTASIRKSSRSSHFESFEVESEERLGFDTICLEPVWTFGWDEIIKADAGKILSSSWTNLDFEHEGGGDFVVVSALFDAGSV
jgi:hypothetical protein